MKVQEGEPAAPSVLAALGQQSTANLPSVARPDNWGAPLGTAMGRTGARPIAS